MHLFTQVGHGDVNIRAVVLALDKCAACELYCDEKKYGREQENDTCRFTQRVCVRNFTADRKEMIECFVLTNFERLQTRRGKRSRLLLIFRAGVLTINGRRTRVVVNRTRRTSENIQKIRN